MPNQFLGGALCLGFFISTLFFYRFWQKTGDRLFLIFAISFFLLGLERIVAAFVPVQAEHQFCVYGFRLLAFILLICAVLDKNRSR